MSALIANRAACALIASRAGGARPAALRRALLLAGALIAAQTLGCHHAAPPAPGDGGSSDAGDSGPPADGGSADGGAGDGGGSDAGVPVKVQALFPAQGPAAGGTNVLVSGSGFVQGFASSGGGAVSARTQVLIGGQPATNTFVIDDNRLQATTPAGTAGAADVTVVNPNGSGTCSGCFRYLAHVAISAVEPAQGPTRGGLGLTVHGSGFDSSLLVTIGGAPLVQLAVLDGATATGLLPPGSAGPAIVAATTRDGRGSLRSGFLYANPLELDGVQPQLVPTAGGSSVALSGHGFSALARVDIDGAEVQSRWVDEAHLVAIAPAHAAGAVSVEVSDPGALAQSDGGVATAQLSRGLVYGDLVATLPGPLQLQALWPTHGPLAGGTCPTACLALVGAGFTQGDLVVTIDGARVPVGQVHVASDQQLTLDLPAGAHAGAVDVALSSAAQAASADIPASDPGAFHYDPLLLLASIAPSTGPASGTPAVALALAGAGFDQSAGAPLEVRVGALDATSVVVGADGSSLTAIAPAGAAGPADVELIATDLDGSQRRALLARAFTFTAPLSLLQVSPASAAQSGGAQLTLYGTGFGSGLTASFAGAAATSVQVVSSTQATCTLPPGSPGAVDVAVALPGQSDLLRKGFTYFDPTSAGGGVSGPILEGTLNVTVLDSSSGGSGGGLLGATIDVLASDGSTLTGQTDARGQLTLFDPRLALPVQVTASKPTYTSMTVADMQVADLTLYLSGPAIPPPPPPDPPPPPPPPPKSATVGGHVYGFKVPPTLTLNANQRVVAYVRLAASSIYGGAPFSSQQTPLVVAHDGGSYSFTTHNLSPFTLYAELGVETNLGTNLTSFAPLLLGVLRGVQPDPAHPLTTADIVLDTHLDASVTATLTDLPDPGPSNHLVHALAVDLDLGEAGIIPISSGTASSATQVSFEGLPAAQGQGFVFIDEVSNGSAESVYLRRVFGDLSQGIELGPYLPFPLIQNPVNQGPPFDGTFTWSISDGLQPNLIQVRCDGVLPGTTADISWSVVLPGTARSVAMPAEVRAQLPAGTSVAWTITASYSPGFDYEFWTYGDIYGTGWISYSYDFNQFTVAP